MSRPCRIAAVTARRGAVTACALALGANVGIMVTAAQIAPAKYSRIERLDQWTGAVERHQPGQGDEALAVFDDWTSPNLAELQITFHSALALTRDPSVRIFFRPNTETALRAVQVLYSGSELRQLQTIAARFARMGHNLVLKRGAMLHTDLVLFGSRADSSGRARRSDFFLFRFSDGQPQTHEDALGHWDMARFLLDQVQPGPHDLRPIPGSDDWVRRWYQTAVAYGLARQYYNVPMAKRSLEIFRDDHDLLFLVGAMHETLASTAVQEAFRGTDYYLRSSLGLSSRRGELNTAEGLLGRALKLNSGLAQARLHLGHVLAEQGEHKKALAELTQALAAIKNPDLLYYGHLFSGRSAAALGQTVAARSAFEQAARLKPNAQSPLLALSHLAYAQGDTGEATAMLARVAALPALDGDDPWWLYNASVGLFFFEPLRRDIVETLRAEMRK
jgi:hypothetical protein